jgi:hypothetical protein
LPTGVAAGKSLGPYPEEYTERSQQERRAKLQDNIRTRLAKAYQELDGTETGSDREAEVQENIASIRAEISSEAEVIEMASRIRIENFTLASNGQNNAQSFYITKERKAIRNISKLVKEDEQEITEPAEIVQELQDR